MGNHLRRAPSTQGESERTPAIVVPPAAFLSNAEHDRVEVEVMSFTVDGTGRKKALQTILGIVKPGERLYRLPEETVGVTESVYARKYAFAKPARERRLDEDSSYYSIELLCKRPSNEKQGDMLLARMSLNMSYDKTGTFESPDGGQVDYLGAELLRGVHPGLQVHGLSGFLGFLAIEACRKLGYVGYLISRPIHPATCIDVLRKGFRCIGSHNSPAAGAHVRSDGQVFLPFARHQAVTDEFNKIIAGIKALNLPHADKMKAYENQLMPRLVQHPTAAVGGGKEPLLVFAKQINDPPRIIPNPMAFHPSGFPKKIEEMTLQAHAAFLSKVLEDFFPT